MMQYDSLESQQRICLEPRIGLKRTDIINIRHEYLADSTRKLEDIDDAVSIELSCEIINYAVTSLLDVECGHADQHDDSSPQPLCTFIPHSHQVRNVRHRFACIFTEVRQTTWRATSSPRLWGLEVDPPVELPEPKTFGRVVPCRVFPSRVLCLVCQVETSVCPDVLAF